MTTPPVHPPAAPDDAGDALDWRIALSDVPPRGLESSRTATAGERAALAAALDALDVAALTVGFRIEVAARRRASAGQGALAHLTGTIEAEVVQACVATLEPVTSRIAEPIRVELRLAADIDPLADIDPDEDWDLEPLDPPDIVPLGRIVYEIVASSLDPFPRAPGAAVDWVDPAEAGGAARSSPFAGLARLKDGGSDRGGAQET